MRIGVISDTHGSVDAWSQAQAVFRDVELIVHAGDLLYHGPRNPLPESYDPGALAALINEAPVPVVIARGNCDAEVDQLMVEWPLQAPYAFIQINDLRILVNHGQGLTSHQMLKQAQRYRANMLIFGHSHLPVLSFSANVLMLNPGSPALPKDDQKTASVAVIDDDRVRLIALEGNRVLAEAALDLPVRGHA